MGWAGPLLAGLGTGFAQAARQRQLQKWDTEQQQYHDTLNFYEGIAKDPRLNPAYLPQVVSGIAQLHGLKPGKKDHDQLVQTVKGLSSLLQGGEGAPTEDTTSQGLVQNPNPTGPAPTQPTQGGMVHPQAGQFNQQPNQVQLPPMPSMNGLQMDQSAGQGFGGRPQLQQQQQQGQHQGQADAGGGQLNPITLPPPPQLMTQGQITTKKALPAFVNPNAMKYDLETQMALKKIAAQGDNAQVLAGQKAGYTMDQIQKRTDGWLARANLNNDAKDEHELKSQMAVDKTQNPKLPTETDDQYDDRIAAISGQTITARRKVQDDLHQAHTGMIQAQVKDFDNRVADRHQRVLNTIAQLDEAKKQHAFSNDMRARYGQATALNKYWTSLENDRNELVDQLNKLKPESETYEQDKANILNKIGAKHSELTKLAETIQTNFEGPFGENAVNPPTTTGKPKLQPKGGGGATQQLSPEQQQQFNRLKQKRPDLTIEQYLNAIKGG